MPTDSPPYSINLNGSLYLIRPAEIDDCEAISHIYNSIISSGIATADTTERNAAYWQSFLFDEGSSALRRFFVATAPDGNITAWLGFSVFKARAAYDATREISLYIAPAHRGKGLGRRLVRLREEIASDLGYRTLMAFVFAHNAASVALLSSENYARWGVLPAVADMPAGPADVVIFGKHLK